MQLASAQLGMDFSVSWKPFFLDERLPGGEGKPKMDHYQAKFGPERVQQMLPRMVQTFADEGIPGYSLDGRIGNTLDSHRLLEYALIKGGAQKQDQLVEVLFDRYFLRGQPLSSKEVLLEAAAAADLEGAEALLSGGELSDDVWSKVESAHDEGVSGVPHFRIDGGGRGKEVSGGQVPEVFMEIFTSLSRTAPGAPSA
uniref:DSBA-like thioredoxin domain-containing protein n=1 Tax=Coccolithus braarudii TaxID=221442 RepID=A0A7S0Q3V7_9EUKA|mmetsp:Transcript_34481/g.73574  ORF Transcript_34481/g.73574 Transcript_34481/m.73574 type:complete len:198 (+) Transcript_34481:132-725(+)